MPLGVREFFRIPSALHTVRKGALDHWHWPAGLAAIELGGVAGHQYLLFRDRKGLVTAFVASLATF